MASSFSTESASSCLIDTELAEESIGKAEYEFTLSERQKNNPEGDHMDRTDTNRTLLHSTPTIVRRQQEDCKSLKKCFILTINTGLT